MSDGSLARDLARDRVAAVDIGTNSVRLLVASRGPGSALREHARRLWLTRLGQGVDGAGALAAAAIARTASAVAEAAEEWQRLGAVAVRITATSAARDARNADEFVQAVVDAAGVMPEVIDGAEEAALSFLGAGQLVSAEGRDVVVIDIGGGSTELVVGRTLVERSTSRQLGSVRMTERHLVGDPPTGRSVASGRSFAADELATAVQEVGSPGPNAVLIAVAGTATTIGAIALGLDGHDDDRLHGLILTREQVSAITDVLLSSPVADIAANPAVQAGREDVIAGGALILDEAMAALGAPALTISTKDLLDGVALRLLHPGTTRT